MYITSIRNYGLDGILIITTVGSEQQAVDIAHALVEKKLAACVSYSMRFHSRYWWNGKVCSDQEVLMLIKSHKRQEKAVIDQIAVDPDFDGSIEAFNDHGVPLA